MQQGSAESYIRNRANLVQHRQAICEAMGIPYSDAMVGKSYFLGRFYADQQQRLDQLGLVNRGFCPICGASPIGTEYSRRGRFSGVVEYICRDCETRTNPFNEPGFAVHHYRAMGCMWITSLGILVAGYLVLRACTN